MAIPMRINLLLNGETPRSGFLNLDPLASPGDELKTRGDLSNLDEFVDDSEAEEIIATDVIDFLPPQTVDGVIDHWIRKLRHGGSIVVGGVDIREVARGLMNQSITPEYANLLLYGVQSAPHEYRKSTMTMQRLLGVFQAKGLKVMHKRIVSYYYQIKADRP